VVDDPGGLASEGVVGEGGDAGSAGIVDRVGQVAVEGLLDRLLAARTTELAADAEEFLVECFVLGW